MKILYVIPFIPWPVKVRSFNLIPRLARHHEITLVCVSGAEPSKEQRAWLAEYCKRTVHVRHSPWKGAAQCAAALPTRKPLRIAYCRSRVAKETVQRVYDDVKPDIVYVERWRALQFVPEECNAPVICDPTDSMTLYNQRLMGAGAWWERLVGWEEFRKFSTYEGKLARRANICIFCSQADMEYVKEQAPDVRCELVPNGVDGEKFFFKDGSKEDPGRIVFTGSFKYRPNYHAAKYFLDDIFPLIRKEVPQANFIAVGNGAAKALAAYQGRAGFAVVDFVPDLRPYLSEAEVAVAPLTVGAGVSNKLAEGFAVGTAVVATPLACGDLLVKSGEHLFIGNNAEEFAGHVVTLLRNPGLRREMATRARDLVDRQFDWGIVAKKMEAVMQSLVERTASDRNQQALATA